MSTASGVSTVDPNKFLTIGWQATQRDRRLKQFLNAQLKSRDVTASSAWSAFNGPDLTLKIKDDHVTVHSLLMSVNCRDFSKWLETHKCFSLPGTVDLTFTKLSKDGLRKMLQFMYDGKIFIDEKSAEVTFVTASYFSMTELRRLLEAYSLQLVSSKTIFFPRWLKIADTNIVNPIYKNDLHRLAAREFRTLVSMEEMSRLPHTVIVELLQRDDLNVNSESYPFRLALLWLQTNKDGVDSDGRAHEILSLVRFANMTTEQRLECLNVARKAGVFELVKPHVIMGDWPKTCSDFRHNVDSGAKPKPRMYLFEEPDREQRCSLPITNRYPQPARKSLPSSEARPPAETQPPFVDKSPRTKLPEATVEVSLTDQMKSNRELDREEKQENAYKGEPLLILHAANIRQSVDIGNPLCLHLVTKETRASKQGNSLRYHRYDCRLNNEACTHTNQWIVKPRH